MIQATMAAEGTCVTKFVADVFTGFSDGYSTCADLLVSTLFAKYGLYNINKTKAHDWTIHHLTMARTNLQRSYIWSDLREISDFLRCSFLYRTAYESMGHTLWMNDNNFNDMTKNYKQSIIGFVQKHYEFLSYCDMEHVGVFLYSNSRQALNKELFLQCYKQADKDLYSIHKKYQSKMPKVLLSILEYFKTVIDVREINGEDMVMRLTDDNIPNFPKLQPHTFLVVSSLDQANIGQMHQTLELLYAQCAHLHVISSLKWLITLQGTNPRPNEFISIRDYISGAREQCISGLHSTLFNPTTPMMLQDLAKLPFISKVFKLIKDDQLLDHHTLSAIGYTVQMLIGNVTRLYLKNIKMMVLADILFLGYYDVLNKDNMPNYKDIEHMIQKAEDDIKNFNVVTDNFTTHRTIKSVAQPATRAFYTSLKKVKRFAKWLKSYQYDDTIEQETSSHTLALIFGDLTDKDGQATTCPICFETSSESKETWWQLASCGHSLHLDCYNVLCQAKHRNCPLCREHF